VGVGPSVTTLRGRGVVSGIVEGIALVCPSGITGWGGIDPKTGEIKEHDNPNRGVSIANRILVMPGSKGSNGWSCYFTAAKVSGCAPAGWIFTRIDSSAGVAATLLGIPTIVDFPAEEDPCVLLRTGDVVRMDGASGSVEIRQTVDGSAAV
jgi:predicted aconitase with swiveling domain